MTQTQTFHVAGMTCDHCVHAVADELQALDGVEAVDVDLAAGTASVTANRQLTDDEVSEALDEAGAYALARS